MESVDGWLKKIMPAGSSLKSFECYHITSKTLRLYYKKKNVGRFYDISMMVQQSPATPADLQREIALDTTCIQNKKAEIQKSSQVDVVLAPCVTNIAKSAGGRNR